MARISQAISVVSTERSMSGYEGFSQRNVSLIDDSATTNGDFPDYRRVTDRLATYKNWPNPHVSPESLARAGFYYLNDSDKVKCAWCSGIVAEWELGDNAFDEHKRLFPNCPLMIHGTDIPLTDLQGSGIQEFKAPKKPMYACLSARLRTYENWPRSDIQKPEVLAQAGFYYQNTDDQVRCFHCNGGLRSWRKEDVPWFEHAKWFPHCHYVQLAKGQSYIDQVVAQMQQQWSQENTNQNAQECFERTMSLEDAMGMEPVRLALQMGLNAGRIKSATKRHLELYGKPYDTAEQLVEAVLEGQASEDVYTEEQEQNRAEMSSSMLNDMSRFFENILNPSRVDHKTQTSSVNQCNSRPTTSPDSTSATVPENCLPNTSTSSNNTSGDATNSDMASEATVELMKQMSLEEENRRLKDARTCKICMDDECGVVFLPCGHLVACVLCAPGISQCPICRSPIKGFVRTYLS